MKLLVDENLAPRLIGELADLFPSSVHVGSAGLSSAPDIHIWEYARANNFALITKDSDFASLSLARGAPPKVILVQIGNCSTATIARVIRQNAIRLSDFEHHGGRGLLILK